ncbi:MAG: isochorismate synthase, partial [Micrococcales bacterium]|nr:isochorismate synthase [Micrococcales bacterium]
AGPTPADGPYPPVTGLRQAPGRHGRQDWLDVIGQALDAIGQDQVEKVVLAREVWAKGQAPVDLRQVIQALANSYPDCWTYCVDGLVGSTPELLVRSVGGLVTSRVLAGTIRRTGQDRADLARAAALARSSKDLDEHEYAVNSVIAALKPYVDALSWPDAPAVLHLANVMHLATDVVGDLTGRSSGGAAWSVALAGALHPTAAVCGTPRAAAAHLIEQLEGQDRGRYAGPTGWMDRHGQGEWGIALRCGQFSQDRREAQLWAGGGIVAASVPSEELAETEAKLQAMRQALGLA